MGGIYLLVHLECFVLAGELSVFEPGSQAAPDTCFRLCIIMLSPVVTTCMNHSRIIPVSCESVLKCISMTLMEDEKRTRQAQAANIFSKFSYRASSDESGWGERKELRGSICLFVCVACVWCFLACGFVLCVRV